MEKDPPDKAEVGRLKACINDLTGLLALPAIWASHEPQQIVAALLDVLMAVLRLDAAGAEIKDPAGGTPISMTRLVRAENPNAKQVLIDRALSNWLSQELRGSYVVSKQSASDLSIIFLRLGWQNELGWICAACDRADFPTEIDRLLLSAATNQAAIALQEARLWSEQRRVARELDEKVAERTRELQELKDQLQRENVMLREQVDEASMFEEIVGTAPVLRLVLSRVAKVAPT
ncbi:MAG: hypothetical protein JO232_00035, partial [Verrucomicrobia bacterium]|nr:hypothetical protein [Verrucomicrobiota bacterium]